MNKAEFKEFIRTPKGKLILALGAMVLSWIFLLLNFSSSMMIALPSESRKAEIKKEIRKLRTELKSLQEKQQQADRQKKNWKNLADGSWQPKRDGDPELLLRQIIEAAARKSELKLNNLGSVRMTRINQDFSFAEMDVSATTKLAPLTAFVNAVQQVKPGIFWRRFSVFVMMRRPRNNSRTVSSNTADDNLIFSGNLRTLVYNPENNGTQNGAGDKNDSVRNAGKSNGSAAPNRSEMPMNRPNGKIPANGGNTQKGRARL